MPENESLATELLHLVKAQSKRWFISFVIVLFMLFVSNLVWLYFWCLPVEEVSTEVEQQTDSGDNNFIGEDGNISYGIQTEGDSNQKGQKKTCQKSEKKAKMMIISDFTKPELDYFYENCNFTYLEEKLFMSRAKGVSLEKIAEELNISSDYARKISQKVNRKILKVI